MSQATSAKVLADSISPDGVRLVTLECVYPRIIHAEMMTHRVFSRNAASSRAIPVQKMITAVQEDPYIPTVWGLNQKGMQSEQFLEDPREIEKARALWLQARDAAVGNAERLLDVGIHKQWVNRLLEPFHWYTCIITATEWTNFFNLRCNPMAHPEIKLAAELMRDAMEKSTPAMLDYGQWHLPLVAEEDWDQLILKDPAHPPAIQQMACKVSVGRCARVSYLTHDGKRDPQADVELHDRLLEAGHMSPFEHVARPMNPESDEWLREGLAGGSLRGCKPYEPMHMIYWCGNFRGWVQYRKTIPGEADILGKEQT